MSTSTRFTFGVFALVRTRNFRGLSLSRMCGYPSSPWTDFPICPSRQVSPRRNTRRTVWAHCLLSLSLPALRPHIHHQGRTSLLRISTSLVSRMCSSTIPSVRNTHTQYLGSLRLKGRSLSSLLPLGRTTRGSFLPRNVCAGRSALRSLPLKDLTARLFSGSSFVRKTADG